MTTPGAVVAFLGKVEVQAQPLGKGTSQLMSDVFLIVLIAFGLFAALVIWARFLRSTRRVRRRTGGQRVYRDPSDATDVSESEEAPAEPRRRFKFRYRRRSHRSRNPTLAETGGLPPPTRTED